MLSGLGSIQISYDASVGRWFNRQSADIWGGCGQIVIWVAKMLYDATYGVRGLVENVKIPL